MSLEPGSFRDRDGRIAYRDGRVFRLISAEALSTWRSLSDKRWLTQAMEKGTLVQTSEVGLDEALGEAASDGNPWAGALEHERIPFVSYPYEWSFSMLRDAALVTLDLLDAALREDFSLKDGTSYNVQFRGAAPTFIDIGSLEPMPAGSAWVGYRQFCQLFLFPLLLQAHKNLDFQPLLRGSLEGISPETANGLFSARDRFRAGVLTHVFLQAKLTRSMAGAQRNVGKELKSAGFSKELIRNNVRNLAKLVRKLTWEPAGSEWGDYTQQHNYDDQDQKIKAEFVDKVSAAVQPKLCWDLGANTGRFSAVAAQHADYLVAADIDHLAVEKHYRSLQQSNVTNILPMVLNLADPSPSWGWGLAERKSLAERGKPDLILALALIHHMVITANIPVEEFIAWLAGLGGHLVIEFVSRDDEMVKRLLMNKKDQYSDYYLEPFEASLKRHFEIVERLPLGSGNRYLYHCSPR